MFVIKPLRVCRAHNLCITFLTCSCEPLGITFVRLCWVFRRDGIVAPRGRHRASQGVII